MKIVRVLAALTLMGCATVAFAHTHLKKAVPAQGSELSASPPNFVLTFGEPAKLTALWLQKGTEPKQKVGPLPAASAAQITIPAPQLTTGTYVLSWRVVADDGHVMPGKLTFTVK
jgi:copper transport protein